MNFSNLNKYTLSVSLILEKVPTFIAEHFRTVLQNVADINYKFNIGQNFPNVSVNKGKLGWKPFGEKEDSDKMLLLLTSRFLHHQIKDSIPSKIRRHFCPFNSNTMQKGKCIIVKNDESF